MTPPFAAALLVASLLAAGDEPKAAARPLREPGKDGLVVARLPYAQQPRYRTFEKKCSRCHELSRALDANFDADRWQQYLRRKNRRSGAIISARQTEEIYQFLAWWSVKRTEE